MEVECVFFGPFREDVGEKTVRLETDADSVGEVLAQLESAYPSLEGRLVGDDGADLAGETVVTVDRTNVHQLDGLETPVDGESVLRLVPSVYGG